VIVNNYLVGNGVRKSMVDLKCRSYEIVEAAINAPKEFPNEMAGMFLKTRQGGSHIFVRQFPFSRLIIPFGRQRRSLVTNNGGYNVIVNIILN